MCGIAAIFGSRRGKEKILQKMLKKISHRGEKVNFGEIENFEYCSLGTNRLAIVDAKQGKQPIYDAQRRYWIILNGEIYNYKELKEELQRKKYKFKTDSDTEVLLNGFIEWKEGVLNKINGIYAFIIYDQNTHTFFSARDPLGVKPLYFTKDKGDNWYFASEIKALSFLKEVQTIENFPPGAFLQNKTLKKFFKLTSVNPKLKEKEAIIKLRKLIDEAVKLRVQTDLPIAVYLSGGVDSTSVLATAMKYHSNVTAIIIGNKQSTDRQTAERYCKENDIKYILKEPPTEEQMEKQIEKIVKITESFEPNMIRQSSISYFIAKAAKDFKIILCGEGADEIFAGYPEFCQMRPPEIEKNIRRFLNDLYRTQLQRVDRTSMFWTTEVREPLLDKNLVDYVVKIPAKLKIKKIGGQVVTKYIFRKAMEDRLPEYIYNRKKVVLSEGAGYKGNQKIGGLFYDLVSKKISDLEFEFYKKEYRDWALKTKEEVYYFKFFLKFKYDKAIFNQDRPLTNQINSLDSEVILAQKIINTFNTWKFKREHPSDLTLLFKAILRCVKKGKAIKFIMYWGVGDRKEVGKFELKALNFLNSILNSIRKLYPSGVELKIIFTDIHAEINGHKKVNVTKYKTSLRKVVRNYDFDLIEMSKMVALEKYSGVKLNSNLLDRLVESAKKHYQGTENPEKIAKWYFEQNQREKMAIAQKFKDAVFLTYNGSDMNELFPMELPIFYMYSVQKGDSEKPWFKQSTSIK